MGAVLVGLLMGVGWVLVMSAFTGSPKFTWRKPRWYLAWADQVTRARVKGLSVPRVIALSIATMLVVFVGVFAWTQVLAVSLIVALITVPLPQMMIAARSRARAKRAREAWPEVVDSLVSGVRAGAGLPELLSDLGESGPLELRPAFAAFGADYRAEGRFDVALPRLKARLADPVADRIVEALRLAREVGGADLSVLLRELGVLLREDLRVRGELEARQSWTVNAARLAVVAPWLVLMLISAQPQAAKTWNSPGGVLVLVSGAAVSIIAYLAMQYVARLSADPRTMR